MENPTIRHLGSAWLPPAGGNTVSGRPLANFTFAVNYAVSGLAPWSYHALNLLVHVLAACALLGVVRRTLLQPALGQRFGEAARPLAAAIAVLWLLHPLQTESVTYVCQRTESLAGLFYLLTLYCFIRGTDRAPRPHPTPDAGGPPERPWLVLSWLFCLAGIGTKEVVATAPVLVLLYDRTFLAGTFREAWRRRRWFHLCLAATWLPLALLVAGTGWNRGGTAGFNVGVSPWAYWLTQFKAVAHYLGLAFWPHPLVFDYGRFWIGLREAAPFASIVLALAAATALALRRWPAAGFLGAWFFVILAPTSLVPGTLQMIVEHRMYLPLAAVLTLAVTGLYAALGRRSIALWPFLAAGLGWMTFARNQAYRSDLTLWSDTVAKAPSNARAHYNLGIACSERGWYAQAVGQDEAALRFETRGAPATEPPALENKLGYDLEQSGRVPEAVVHFERALRLMPDYAKAHENLAEALMREGRLGEAIGHWQAAARIEPASAAALNNLAYALLLDGRADDAVAAYREAVRFDPGLAAAQAGLGYALIQAGRPTEALDPCGKAVRLAPDSADARNTLGIALAQTGRTAEAIAAFSQAIRLNPDQADVHNNLGNALAAAGRRAEAVAQYREALRLDPGYAPALRNLQDVLRPSPR